MLMRSTGVQMGILWRCSIHVSTHGMEFLVVISSCRATLSACAAVPTWAEEYTACQAIEPSRYDLVFDALNCSSKASVIQSTFIDFLILSVELPLIMPVMVSLSHMFFSTQQQDTNAAHVCQANQR